MIITGANNGIGAAAAKLFAAEGAKIAAIDIREPATPSSDPNRLDIKCSVASESEVIAAVKQIVEKWGTIDVLCNVAGVMDRFGRSFPSTAAVLLRDGMTRVTTQSCRY